MIVGAPSTDINASEPDSWVLLGDENIANVHCGVRWRMSPGQVVAYAYSAANHEQLVRSAAASALRMVLGSAEIDTVFTTAQTELAQEVRVEAQKILDAGNCGLEIVAFDFLDLHAPREVHEAFRDVASKLEEKSTRRYEALGDQVAGQLRAEGTRKSNLLEAQAYSVRVRGEAAGHAERFRQRWESYVQFMDVTRTRLMFEMYDRVLPGLKKCVKPSKGNVQIDLRFRSGNQQEQEAPPL
jgi:membrane protease subunit HflK